MDPEQLTPEQAQAAWEEIAAETAAESSPVATPASHEQTQTKDETDPADAQAAEGGESKAPEAADKAVAQDDPLAALPQAVRDKLAQVDQLIELTNQLKRHVGSAEGRVAAMQRELDVAKNAAKTASEGPSSAQIAAASTSPEKWESLKSDFPEWAEATEAFVNAKLAGLAPQQTQGLTTEQVNELVTNRVAGVERLVEEAKIEGKHPDWRDTVKGDDFVKWFKAQSQELQQLAGSTSGRDVIKVLDEWTKAKAEPVAEIKTSRAEKLAAAVTTKPGAAPAAKSVEQMSPQELWNYEAKLRAKRTSA